MCLCIYVSFCLYIHIYIYVFAHIHDMCMYIVHFSSAHTYMISYVDLNMFRFGNGKCSDDKRLKRLILVLAYSMVPRRRSRVFF